MKSHKPWLDENGKEKSVEELKKITPSWDHKTWMRYAASLEVPLSESYLDRGTDIDSFTQEELRIDYPEGESFKDFKGLVKGALPSLPLDQREIIDSLFYKGQSIQEVAEEKGVTARAIQKTKDKALETLRKRIIGFDNKRSSLKRRNYSKKEALNESA